MHGNRKLIARLAQIIPIILMVLLVSPGAMAAFDEDHMEAINGTHLHFRVRGKDKANPYLLVLHGGPGASALEFYPWGRLLEESLNVVYLDQRGSGLSERKPFATPGHPTDAEAEEFTFEQPRHRRTGTRLAEPFSTGKRMDGKRTFQEWRNVWGQQFLAVRLTNCRLPQQANIVYC